MPVELGFACCHLFSRETDELRIGVGADFGVAVNEEAAMVGEQTNSVQFVDLKGLQTIECRSENQELKFRCA